MKDYYFDGIEITQLILIWLRIYTLMLQNKDYTLSVVCEQDTFYC